MISRARGGRRCNSKIIGSGADCSELGNRTEGGNPPAARSREGATTGELRELGKKLRSDYSPAFGRDRNTKRAEAEALRGRGKVSRNSARSRHASPTQNLPAAQVARRAILRTLGAKRPAEGSRNLVRCSTQGRCTQTKRPPTPPTTCCEKSDLGKIDAYFVKFSSNFSKKIINFCIQFYRNPSVKKHNAI